MCASSGAEQDALRASVALGFLALAAIELGGVAVALAVAPVDESDSNRWVDEALARELRTLIYTAAAAFAALAAAAAIEQLASGRQGSLASRRLGLVKALLKIALGVLAAAVGVTLSLVLRRALCVVALAVGTGVVLVALVIAPAAATAVKPADATSITNGSGDALAVAATTESAPGGVPRSPLRSPPPSRLQWLRSPLARSGSRRSGSMSYPAWADGGALGLV